MKEVSKIITYRGEQYKIVFNLNVMEIIQEEYGTIDKWGALTDGKSGETNVKALLFGFAAMINEGIEIDNDEKGENRPLIDKKKAGRILSDLGVDNTTSEINELVIESARSDEKNA